MTFKIVDGREYFYQWDLNRQIIIDDPAIKEVHFCNRNDDCSLVVEVENGIANVPNILLQKSFSIRVFAYDGHATLFDKVFEVKARTRPSDYVYTETEVKRLEDVEEKLFKEINERLEEIEGGLITDGFATKEYVDEAVSNASVDLSGYAKESYVDEAIAQVVSEHETDLVEYAKKTEIPDVSKFITNIPSEYITESELNSKGYLTQHQSLNHKADKNHTHSYNDLTNKPTIPSIAGLATESYVDNAIKNIEIPEVDLSNVYTKATNINITNEPAGTENIVLTTDKTGIPNVSEAALVMVKDNNGGFDNVLTRGAAFGKEAIYTKGAGSEVQTLSYPRNVSGTIATEEYVTEAIANIEIPEPSEGIKVIITKANTGADIEAILADGKIPVLYDDAINLYASLSTNTSSSYTFSGSVGSTIKYYDFNKSTQKWDYETFEYLQEQLHVNPSTTTDVLTGLTIDGVSYAISGGSGGGSGWDLSDRISGGGNKTTPNETNPGNVRIGDISTIMNISKGYSLAVGIGTQINANAKGAFAAGYDSANKWGVRAFGHGSIGMGYSTKTDSISAAATGAAAIGYGCAAETEGAIALGKGTIVTPSNAPGMTVCGSYNVDSSDGGFIFVVGNGTSSSVRSNAFTVDTSGNVVAAGTVSPTGADYAEYFEFEDENTNNEDRIGLLVELVNGKIRLANGTDILGAISGSKGVIGDAEEMNWHGKYERDEFGRCVYEEIRRVQNEGTEFEFVEVAKVKKISKDYDPNKTYIPRSKRPEWAPVGLLGKVLVRHDGTLSAGDYVKAINGIASKSEEKTNIRVLEVVSENVIRVLIK